MLQKLSDYSGWGCPEELLKFLMGHTSHTIMRAVCSALDAVMERDESRVPEGDALDDDGKPRKSGVYNALDKAGELTDFDQRKMYNRFMRFLERPETAFISDEVPAAYIRTLYAKVDRLRNSWDKRLGYIIANDEELIFRVREKASFPGMFGGYETVFKHLVRVRRNEARNISGCVPTGDNAIPTVTINRADGKGAWGFKYSLKKLATINGIQ
jgi:hypothetical protein